MAKCASSVSPSGTCAAALGAALILFVAAIATAIPARAGTRIDPVRALRAD